MVLYVDLGSPYAYLAVARARQVLGREPALQPVLLGALFGRRGHGSWSQTPRRAERMAEVERRAAAYGLPPVVWPAGWPNDGLAAMRAATWAAQLGAVEPFTREVFRLQFTRGADISDVGVLVAAADAAGLPGTDLPSALGDPAVKAALREATDAAWAAGVHGVPTLRIGDRLLFGDDQLHLAAA